jgi:hypothetical protein
VHDLGQELYILWESARVSPVIFVRGKLCRVDEDQEHSQIICHEGLANCSEMRMNNVIADQRPRVLSDMCPS